MNYCRTPPHPGPLRLDRERGGEGIVNRGGEQGTFARSCCPSGLWLEDAGLGLGQRFEILVSYGRLVLRTV